MRISYSVIPSRSRPFQISPARGNFREGGGRLFGLVEIPPEEEVLSVEDIEFPLKSEDEEPMAVEDIGVFLQFGCGDFAEGGASPKSAPGED